MLNTIKKLTSTGNDPVVGELLKEKVAPELVSNIKELTEIPSFAESEEAKLLLMGKESDLSPQIIYILKTLSRLDQNVNWVNGVILDINRQARKTNGSVVMLREWHHIYDDKILAAIKKIEVHEQLLERAITVKTSLKYILTSIISIISGLLLGAEFFSKLFH